MNIPESSRYYVHFDQKNQGEKKVYAFFTAVFGMIFWVMYCLLPFIDTFGGKLFHSYEQFGVTYKEPTGHGILVFFWYAPMAVALLISLIHGMYHLLVLKDIKKEQELSWLETFAGFIHYNKSAYNHVMLNASIVLTSVLLPLLSFIPNDLTNGMRVLLLYFISFLALSTYGLRENLLERKWKKAVQKEEKKQKKEQMKAAKEEAKKQKEMEKQPESTATPTLSEFVQLIDQSLGEKEYQLPHFKEEVEQIVQEVRYFVAHNRKSSVEDQHMIERILKEEVPAVLATYNELDAESKHEYYPELKDCLEKIQLQLAARNKGRQDIKKLGAQKVIEIIKHRY